MRIIRHEKRMKQAAYGRIATRMKWEDLMVRSALVSILLLLVATSCARMDQRSARYDATACPVCSNITDGTCSFCKGSTKCTYCDGKKERTEVSPNYTEEQMKSFSYKTACEFCKSSGVCTYCKGAGKCWACNGTKKVSPDWQCLNTRQQAAK
jgi:hypothetical protein